MLRVLLTITVALGTIASAQPTFARSIFNKSILVKAGGWEVYPRLKRYLLQAGEAQETKSMRTFFARLIVLAAACGWAGSACCAPLHEFGGRYEVQADVFDGSFPGVPNADHVSASPNFASGPSGASATRQLGTSAGNAIASGQVSYSSGPGVLAVYADAAANATNGGFSSAVAGARTFAEALMTDEWVFQFGTPSKHTHVNAKFNLSADLTTTADGVNGTSANSRRDEVDARATSVLHVGGNGIPGGLYPEHGPDVFGFFEEGILSQTINPHTRQNPPTTIPVSLDFEGTSGIVTWFLIVEAHATVADLDVINRQSGLAIAIADASHTLTWGGITSVTNADTGELITDYTLTSASGFDYTHPFSGPIPEPGSVPEPSSIGLLASCLALMLLWRSGVARHH